MTNKSVNNDIPSYGERLYRKGKAIKSIYKRLSEVAQKEKQATETKECVFAPKISSYTPKGDKSRTFVRQYHKSQIEKEDEEYAEVLKNKQNKKLSQEEIDYLTEKLHNEKVHREVKREMDTTKQLNEECPFTPSILDKTKPSEANFFGRLQYWVEKKNENHFNEVEASYYDKNTGQPLFQPVITEFASQRVEDREDPHQALYEDYFVKKQRQSMDATVQRRSVTEISNAKLMSDKSEEIMFKVRRKLFAAMFKLYANPETETIGGDALDDEDCPEKFELVLQPVLEELRADNYVLNEKEFVVTCERLYKNFSHEEKRAVMDLYHENRIKEACGEEPTFKPKISKKSKSLFNNTFSSTFLQRNAASRESFSSYVKEMRVQTENDELKECTFKPAINRKSLQIDHKRRSLL